MTDTAASAYGFNGWVPSVPGGTAVMAETQVGSSGDIPSGAMGKLPLHWNNPLFWLLALVLVWTGYLYGGFDIGVKKIGSTRVKLGRG